MERRTVLTALAAAPLAALASTAHALGRRRRQCCEQQSYAENVQSVAGDVPKGMGTPILTITAEPSMPGMPIYKIVITVDVTALNLVGKVAEEVTQVEARLLDSSGSEVFGYFAMTGPPATPPPPPHGAGTYRYEQSGVLLSPLESYLAQVRSTIQKSEFGFSGPQTPT